jgi:RNA-binding protein
MPPRLSNPEIRKLKAAAQRMKATFKVGKAGLSPQFLQSVDEGLKHHELIKVKFDEFKELKKELAPVLAEKTSSHLIMQVGNVVVLFRRKPEQFGSTANRPSAAADPQPTSRRLATGWQPAVSPTGSRQAVNCTWRVAAVAAPAGYQPAIQQTASLRYDEAAKLRQPANLGVSLTTVLSSSDSRPLAVSCCPPTPPCWSASRPPFRSCRAA